MAPWLYRRSQIRAETAVAVADEDPGHDHIESLLSEGILLEPTAAVSLTAVRKASQSGVVKGHGYQCGYGNRTEDAVVVALPFGEWAQGGGCPASEFAELTEESAKKWRWKCSAELIYQRLCADFLICGRASAPLSQSLFRGWGFVRHGSFFCPVVARQLGRNVKKWCLQDCVNIRPTKKDHTDINGVLLCAK